MTKSMTVPMASPRPLPRRSFFLRKLLVFVFLASFCVSISNALPSQVLNTGPQSGFKGWLASFSQLFDSTESLRTLLQPEDTKRTPVRQGKLVDDFHDEARPGLHANTNTEGNSLNGLRSRNKHQEAADDVGEQGLKTEKLQPDLQPSKSQDAVRLGDTATMEQQRRENFPRAGGDRETQIREQEQEEELEEVIFNPALLFDLDQTRPKKEDNIGRESFEDEEVLWKDKEEDEQETLDLRVPYLLGPSLGNWDRQRAEWLSANPQWKAVSDTPRVLVVSGSSPLNCPNRVGNHLYIKTLKQKIDYARMHSYEFYYNFVYMDPLFNTFWVKLPTIRKLMLTHPEIEWFFWVDGDAVFTDMLFEAPWHTYEGYDMVMWGLSDSLLQNKSCLAINDGVFLLRNSQWSLDLIDKWSPFGPDGHLRTLYGEMLSAFLTGRTDGSPSDDQSALAYLILTDETVRSNVKLVDTPEYIMSGYWVDITDTFETSVSKYHPGLGDWRWPWITHFTGCNFCSAKDDSHFRKCLRAFNRAFNFADNQVLAYMGFQHESLSSENMTRVVNDTKDHNLDFVGVNPWKERIAQVAAAAQGERSGDLPSA